MNRHYLSVSVPTEAFRVICLMSAENQERMKELAQNDEKVMAEFMCKNLTVIVKTPAGSTIYLRESKSPK